MSSHIIFRKREIIQAHKKRRSEAIIMLSMLQSLTIPVHRHDMNMQVVHGRMCVDPTHDILLPVSPRGQLIQHRFHLKRLVSLLVLL